MTVDLAALAKLASDTDSLHASYGRGNRRDDEDYLNALTRFQQEASPDVVLALVRVALAAQDLIDWDDGRHYGQEPPLATLRDALADLDR